MKLKLFLIPALCLSYFVAPAAAAAAKGVLIGSLSGASGGQSVVIQTKPPQPVVVEHKPVTLVPVTIIPSYGLTDKLSRLWGGISDSISTKIRAIGNLFHGPPNVVVISKPTTTKKPISHQPPVILEIVGVPHHRVYPMWSNIVARK